MACLISSRDQKNEIFGVTLGRVRTILFPFLFSSCLQSRKIQLALEEIRLNKKKKCDGIDFFDEEMDDLLANAGMVSLLTPVPSSRSVCTITRKA